MGVQERAQATPRPCSGPRRLAGSRSLAGGRFARDCSVIWLFPEINRIARRGIGDGGFLGVDIFFVLSGFLITALLLDEISSGGIRFRNFYARRGLRLLPALYVLLVVHAIWASIVVVHFGKELRTIENVVLYWTNWQGAWHFFTVAPGMGHLWSLAVEEQFYILWPIVLLVLASSRVSRSAVACIVAAAIAVIAVHRYDFAISHLTRVAAFVRTDTRADSLLVGALLAWCWSYGLLPRVEAIFGWLALAGIAVGVAHGRPLDPGWYQGGFTLFALLVATVICVIMQGDWIATRVFELRPLVLLGRVSYGLYLWHLPIFFAVTDATPNWQPLARLTVALTLTAAATTASWKFVERPASRLRSRFSHVARAERLAAATSHEASRHQGPTADGGDE